ncbi:uncharacterized protein BDW43DRAFT_292896 [Aspergillus alliaceus]|uniref:uncharacterized protein n=1 Tax=Petromyces alliaceus TaxID=209559 RepID=UPI0012A574E4|nr:uncharacterized protein BDW43DRAFT_292896 [Aspergillus alliaceus]KAB8227848.1 hypothetical protein BDW43DRAFT_292896 [Aspergillus alliaceus]
MIGIFVSIDPSCRLESSLNSIRGMKRKHGMWWGADSSFSVTENLVLLIPKLSLGFHAPGTSWSVFASPIPENHVMDGRFCSFCSLLFLANW